MTRLTATNTDAALDKITHIMAELALDDDQRDTLVGHLDRVCVPQLVRGEPATNTGESGGPSELLASG